ncbi:hypothetical protein IAE22_26275 [Bacillus sp. S34]|nr:hypothetical protein [Bacillus sp. S34]
MEIASNNDKMYVFLGQFFMEYVDVSLLKKSVFEKTSFKERKDKEEFGEFYLRFLRAKPNEKDVIDRLFFENILYGRLTNVFVSKLDNKKEEREQFIKKTKKFIEEINEKNSLSSPIKDSMNPEGFYQMDQIYTTEKNKFIAGMDIESDGEYIKKARFLYVQVVPTGTKQNMKMTYLVSGIEIDYENQWCIVSIKNKTDILNELDDKKDINNTVLKNYNFTRDLFFNTYNLNEEFNSKKDQEGMLLLCKELDDKLLADPRAAVSGKVDIQLDDTVETLLNNVFGVPCKSIPSIYHTNLKKRINSLLLATYIEFFLDDLEIRKKAKELKLIGYPTKVSFKNENEAKSSTGSSGATDPIATSPMFHSLYSDFEETEGLSKWSLSWFTDYKHLQKSTDVIQTTINVTSNYFKVTFLNKRHTGEELISHVVRTLNQYRK